MLIVPLTLDSVVWEDQPYVLAKASHQLQNFAFGAVGEGRLRVDLVWEGGVGSDEGVQVESGTGPSPRKPGVGQHHLDLEQGGRGYSIGADQRSSVFCVSVQMITQFTYNI